MTADIALRNKNRAIAVLRLCQMNQVRRTGDHWSLEVRRTLVAERAYAFFQTLFIK